MSENDNIETQTPTDNTAGSTPESEANISSQENTEVNKAEVNGSSGENAGEAENSGTGDTPKTSEDETDVKTPEDFDYSTYEKEFYDTGTLSDKSREELYKLFPKNLVDNYISNMQGAFTYAVSQTEKKAFDAVGGESNYQSMIAWANKTLDKEEVETFNRAVGGKDEKLALTTIKGLYARMSLESSKKPSLMMGGASTSSASSDVFLTRTDYANEVASEKYATSPQFRADIDAKLSRTLKAGGFRA